MWFTHRGRNGRTVTCIACDAVVARSDAREYDRFGDRWDRLGKEFEYLCKACHRDCCHYPRDDLEAVLVEAGAGERPQDEFLSGYWTTVEERYGGSTRTGRSER